MSGLFFTFCLLLFCSCTVLQLLIVAASNRMSCISTLNCLHQFWFFWFVCVCVVVVCCLAAAGQAAHGRPARGQTFASTGIGPLQRPGYYGAWQGGTGEPTITDNSKLNQWQMAPQFWEASGARGPTIKLRTKMTNAYTYRWRLPRLSSSLFLSVLCVCVSSVSVCLFPYVCWTGHSNHEGFGYTQWEVM